MAGKAIRAAMCWAGWGIEMLPFAYPRSSSFQVYSVAFRASVAVALTYSAILLF